MNCGCEQQAEALEATGNDRRRTILWTVLTINAVLFAGEFGAVIWADSCSTSSHLNAAGESVQSPRRACLSARVDGVVVAR
ncbi:MAG: hypothetical protein LC637_14210 [Xanthomonadaceae bacterium]|nr:hypothetical protein [Xanthomonadaceae bacterium]